MPIKTQTENKTETQSETETEIETETETETETENDSLIFKADACVVTLPMGVLKSGDVKFKPEEKCN